MTWGRCRRRRARRSCHSRRWPAGRPTRGPRQGPRPRARGLDRMSDRGVVVSSEHLDWVLTRALRSEASSPDTGDWRLATGDWRLATGDWRLATGDWRLATGD